jgi:hypothetical protein
MAVIYSLSEEHFKDWYPVELGDTIRAFWADDKRDNRLALVIAHRHDDDGVCATSVFVRAFGDRNVMGVESWDPLTLKGEILCDCGMRGYIVNGRWQDA